MKIKHWDKKLNKWVISGASDASGIALTNPSFVDENGIPITVDKGFTKIANNLSRIEDNLAWIYLNGAHGGGGGTGPGGGGETIRIELVKDTIYTSTGSVDFQMLINSGSVARNFSIEFKDLNTGKIIYKTSGRSLRYLDITLPNIEKSTVIEITAMDNAYNQAIPARLPIIVGAVSLSISETPKRTIDIHSLYQFNLTFYIKNEISGAQTDFIMEVNGEVKEERLNLLGNNPSLTYSMLQFLTDEENGFNPAAGKKYLFRTYARTKLDGVEIMSNVITYELTVVDSTTLNIVTTGIGTTPSTATPVVQGTDIKINYYLSYSPSRYSTFEVLYKVFLVKGMEESLVRQGQTTTEKGTDKIIFIGTIEQPITEEGEYLRIDIESWATYGEFDSTARDKTSVYATILLNEDADLTANNDSHGLLAYYSGLRWTPLSDDTNWRYFWEGDDIDSLFFYNHSPFIPHSKNGVNLKLNKTNGNTTGFINAGTVANPVNGIVLNGESYANLEIGHYMFPDTTDFRNSFFQETGFNFSITYRAKSVPDVSKVIMSIGRYENNELRSGIEVTLDKAVLKVEYVDSIEVKLPLGELITLDFDVSETAVGWYFKIYLNGVLSAVTRVEKGEDIKWTFGEDLYFGCRNDKGTLSRFSDVTFYDIKVYTKSQSEVAIVQNYISATEQASLKNGIVDIDLDRVLRAKNFFDRNGKCMIWDYRGIYLDRTPGYLRGRELYNTLVGQIDPDDTREIRTPYPVIRIKENSLAPTDFKKLSTAVFPETNKEEIMSRRFNCQIDFISEEGSETITTATDVSEDLGVKVGLQGTSSLSYSSKNYEIYLGQMKDGRNQLFTPKNDWLPENQFTLKADVMDSAHVNNVVIGKIINGEVKDQEGKPLVPMVPTHPMKLADSNFIGEDGTTRQAAEIKSKMKHTSDGFPCLLFIEYAPEAGEVEGEMRFMGIYNFNLGRHAHHNLGLELLQSYVKRDGKDGPAVIESYKSNPTFANPGPSESIDWNGGKTGGVYSLEVSQNNSTYGAFQQGDMSIVDHMIDPIYSSRPGSNLAMRAAQVFFEQMAIRVKKGESIPPYRLDDDGVLRLKENTPNYEYVEADYTFTETRKFLSWENAVNYYLLVLIFGMVDSTVKNLTLRSWGEEWHPSFYDMDTAFGIDNAGQDTVEYWAHLHYWRNVTSTDGLTTYAVDRFYPHDNPRGLEQHFAAYWNRIWEIVETLPGYDSDATDRTNTLENRYVALRTSLFKDPEKFIEDHYKSYTDQTGSIIFNYDYKIKYLELKQEFNESTQEFESTTDFSQLAFLHGNRVVHVKDWFKKRIYFLDGIYGFNHLGTPSFDYTTALSPINTVWIDNRATGSSSSNLVTVNLEAPSKMLFQWSHGDSNLGSFWIENSPTEGVVTQVGGFNVVSFYANKFITKFENFKGFNWSALRILDFPSLRELDLSGMINVNVSGNFLTEVANIANNTGLVSIEKLLLRDVKFRKEDQNRDYRLDLSQCHYLNHLDVSNSDFTQFALPSSASLKYYNLSNTSIPSLNLKDQSFLETLILDGCDNLTTVTIENCNSLRNINLPPNVKTLEVLNCPLLEELNITYRSSGGLISGLTYINVERCDGLKVFNISGQNNEQLKVSLNGAPNLEHLDFSYTNTQNILLPNLKGDKAFKTLRSLDISNTKIKYLEFNDDVPGETDTNRLNLLNFNNLDTIKATYNSSVQYIDCVNNKDSVIRLNSAAFSECTGLKELNGHFSIEGQEVFKNCAAFELNDVKYYESAAPSDFLIGENRTNIKINTTSLRSVFFGCSSLSFDDFKRIQAQFIPGINSLEDTFNGCINIRGEIRRDLFTKCRDIEILKGAFKDTSISGPIVSRSDSFSMEDETTWGTFDYIPKLTDAESAFSGTLIDWIDNKLFQPVGDMKYEMKNINGIFKDCNKLASALDTRVDPINIEEGVLNSETFFIGLESLSDVYPENVFENTFNVRMEIVNREIDGITHTLLYHTKRNRVQLVLDHSLYNGVKLIGEIKENVFGGIKNEFIDGKYFIPKFRSIIRPFSNNGNDISIDLGNMSNIFYNIREGLLKAEEVFSGLNCLNNNFVPNNIFEGCSNLNSIRGIFSNLDVTNNNNVYNFPHKDMFKDTISLEDISNIFSNTNKMKIKLQGEGFINCKLKNVSNAFSRSGVFGTIPYRLFFMEQKGTPRRLVRTIENMQNIFRSCWLLGYDSKREIDIGSIVENYEDEYGVHTRFTTWNDNIVKTEGNPVYYKLTNTQLSKVYNYRVDTKETIINPDYDESKLMEFIPNPEYDAEFNPDVPQTIKNPEYDPDVKEIIPNPDYDPNEYHFDPWYMDGNTWDDLEALRPEDSEDFEKQKARLEYKYFVHDRKQKQSIEDARNTVDLILQTSQNYMIPTDLFRYCSVHCDLSGVLSSLNWNKRHIVSDGATGKGDVIDMPGPIVEGLKGRIPAKLFEDLRQHETFNGVFRNTRFDPYYNVRGIDSTNIKRGVMYPHDLFMYNTEIRNMPYMFSNTKIPSGIDINKDLFKNIITLRNVSNMWSDTLFSDKLFEFADQGVSGDYNWPQIPFEYIFSKNVNITNAARLFAVYNDPEKIKGIRIVDKSLLKNSRFISDVSNMFYYNSRLNGTVPPFEASVYQRLSSVDGYLTGVNENQVQNSKELNPVLRPLIWDREG